MTLLSSSGIYLYRSEYLAKLKGNGKETTQVYLSQLLRASKNDTGILQSSSVNF